MAGDDFGIDEGYDDDGIEDPDGYAVAMAAGELSVITNGAKVLKAVAALAAGLWILAVITIFWNWYDLARTSGMAISFTGTTGANNSVLQALATTLGSTWGYLLVAVVAYTGAMVLHGQRMRLLIAAADSDD